MMNLITGIIFIASFVLAIRYADAQCKRLGAGFGSIFGLFQILGKVIFNETDWEIVAFMRLLPVFVWIVFGAGSIAALFFQIFKSAAEKQKESAKEKRISFFAIYVILLVCYIGCFIAYFPGCMSYDSWYITLQALGIIGFDNHHPFLHTFIWSLFAHMDEWLGIDQIGIALYTTTQLLAMLAIYAYACVWLFRRGAPGLCKKIAVFYYAVNPVFHIFTLILTKDVLFSGFFLLLCITVIDFSEGIKKNADRKALQVRLALVSLMCCLFRNNMIYVLVVMTLILLLVFRLHVSACRGLLAAIVLYYVVVGVVYPGVGVAKGSLKELLSVPLSQIASVYQNETEDLSEEDRELILKYIPDVEQYDRFFADYIKSTFNESAFRENKGEFTSLWFRLFKEYPGLYVKAFLSLNLPYWYPGMDSVREYIETDNYSQDYPVQRMGALPLVYDWYEDVSENDAVWMHWPVFRQLYAIGMPIWILLFFGMWFCAHKRRTVLAAMAPCILLWLTYLLGPVSCFRYIEPLLLTYPIWFVLSFEKEYVG